ncbi:MAG: hypothetical protein CMP53_09235 [Flavobacteriales bacterium]|nr:hypothetical protein [Flavobacteriales bacterium]|tara:strand:+ start:1083 stop:2141 length:1059 start_codon:yes stop_codon:yes gene_type:complete
MTNEAAWALERMPDDSAWAKNELSQSKMKDGLNCMYKFLLERIDKTKNRKRKGAALPMGSAFHGAVEVYHNTIRKGFDADMDLILDIARSTFMEEYEREKGGYGVDGTMGYPKPYSSKKKEGSIYHESIYRKPHNGTPLHEVGVVDGSGDTAMERAIKTVQYWVACYIGEHQSGKLPLMDSIDVGCEVDYRRFFPDLGVYLRGKLDIVFNENEIGDWKTANINKQWQFCTERADAEIQADWYAAIMLGDEVGEIIFHYISIVKQLHPDYQESENKKKAEVMLHSTTRTKADVKQLLERVKAFLLISDFNNDYQDGFFTRNPAGNGYSHCDKLCDVKDECYSRLIADREGAKE